MWNIEQVINLSVPLFIIYNLEIVIESTTKIVVKITWISISDIFRRVLVPGASYVLKKHCQIEDQHLPLHCHIR